MLGWHDMLQSCAGCVDDVEVQSHTVLWMEEGMQMFKNSKII
jgi:hypothetical protein